MKKLLIIAAGVLFATSAFAGSISGIELSVTAATNAAATTASTDTSSRRISGWVDTIILNLSGYASPTVDVDVVTLGGSVGGTGSQRTLLSFDSVTTTNGIYPVRDIVTTTAGGDIANTPAYLPLINDRVQLKVYDCNTNGAVTATMYLILRKTP